MARLLDPEGLQGADQVRIDVAKSSLNAGVDIPPVFGISVPWRFRRGGQLGEGLAIDAAKRNEHHKRRIGPLEIECEPYSGGQERRQKQ